MPTQALGSLHFQLESFWTAFQVYPDCTVKGVVLRHAGEHAIFADLSHYGHSGCFLNDCICVSQLCILSICFQWFWPFSNGLLDEFHGTRRDARVIPLPKPLTRRCQVSSPTSLKRWIRAFVQGHVQPRKSVAIGAMVSSTAPRSAFFVNLMKAPWSFFLKKKRMVEVFIVGYKADFNQPSIMIMISMHQMYIDV